MQLRRDLFAEEHQTKITDMRVQLNHLMSQLENIKDVKLKKKKPGVVSDQSLPSLTNKLGVD